MTDIAIDAEPAAAEAEPPTIENHPEKANPAPKTTKTTTNVPKPKTLPIHLLDVNTSQEMQLEEESPEEAMARMMGISSFGTTKGQKVVGNDIGAVDVKVKRQYRQYMNRRGGFNRPLDEMK